MPKLASPSAVPVEALAPMPDSQRSGAAGALWRLGPDEALRLPVGPGPRRLEVVSGRLWLTRSAGRVGAPDRVDDCWLAAGDGIDLAAGDEVVVDAHPQAAFRLVVPPAACRTRATTGRRGGRMPFSLGGGLWGAEPA